MAPFLAPSPNNLSPPKSSTTRKQLSSNKITHDNPSDETESPIPVLESETKLTKIWVSNVKANKPKKYMFAKNKWRYYKGITKLVAVIMLHGLAMFAPFTCSWGAFWLMLGLGSLTGVIGISFSFHRNLTHKSFTLPKWLEYFFAYIGSLAFQEDPIEWVRNHRSHHKYVDSERDPHSPTQGFWFSHINWIFYTTSLAQKRDGPSIVKDLETQKFYKFIRDTYLIHQFALGLLLYFWGGFPYVVWGMGVRIILVFHTTFCVNSVCHIWGTRAWNTRDLSRNNWWVALMTGGEGWHNNHHAFEYSARHGLKWWEIDTAWYLVRFLEIIGVAKDVKVPTEAHKQRFTYKTKETRG